jgi:hypothetical protein
MGHPSSAGSRTLAARLEDRDRKTFVGRESELALLGRCLDDDPPASVVLVYGPGGIGKSTLLRELARRATARGWDVFAVEGRELAPSPDSLAGALLEARESKQPLVLIDTFERMSALAGDLRRLVLPSLPDRTVVVIAGRNAPDPEWFTGGWEGVAMELALGPLHAPEAMRLLEAHGVSDRRASAILEWAEGSPLALALAADTAAATNDWNPRETGETSEILRSLVRRLVEAELRGVRVSVLGVAALARVVTPELLRAVLPESEADAAYDRLQSLSFTEPLGDGVTLHELVRKTLRADFQRRDPDRDRDLRRRIVDYLYERGELLGTIDMAHLIENPAIKWGFGWEGAIDHRLDHVRPGDGERIAELLTERRFGEWWDVTRRFFTDAPERVAIVRGREDRLCGYLVCMTPDTAPEFAWEDPLVGPWLAHARGAARHGDSVLWHDSVDFTRDRRGRVQAMLGVAGVIRSGTKNPRFAYLPISPGNPAAVAFAAAIGAEHLEELDLELDSRRIECHRVDYGPGGLLAAQRELVYRELGLPSPRSAIEVTVDVETVREALRSFRLPHVLAASALASGDSPAERVDSVRELLREAAARAFGDNENEKLLQRVLVHGYLESSTSHEQVAFDLSLSRAAYFRRLRVAAERVAEWVVEARGASVDA